ncbi:MAG: glycoside hydrolase family 2, partial [Calditrichaeota bacterium]|nr:glycoside hydrolase family 2 [Calditrichota bacterium]
MERKSTSVLGLIFIIVCFVGSLLAASNPETEIHYLSGRGSDDTVLWQFKVTGGRQANEWTTIPVPSNWELQGFGAYNYGHDHPKSREKGFYRTYFTVSAQWKQKRIFIVFEGVMTDTEVRINGQLAGPVHRGGFYRFRYEITPWVHFDRKNFLQVLVSKVSADSTVELAERRADYWVFGGIYRPVYLEAVPQAFIDWTAIDARADGLFRARVTLNGAAPHDRVTALIFRMDGSPLGKSFATFLGTGKTSVLLETQVTGQKNWTAETPHLYWVEFRLQRGKTVLHTVRKRFGFRTFTVRPGKGLFLNGKRIVLKGCSRHSFWPTTGRALNRNRCRKDILTIKQMNMNAVRMSHYPPDSYFLDQCDELGLYVLDELGGWQRPPYATAVGKKLLAEMLKRDVNHPSILFWDNGNEGGWNPNLDGEFARYDLQHRTVLHPGALFNRVDAHHYPSYARLQKELKDSTLVLPTEILHGLYDGGLGAGLDDYWKLLYPHPHFGGMFLWVFADEGVVRTDKNCFIDTDGNHAPDGILGPFHEKEASFYTIREIWSPVFIETANPLPSDFTGDLPVENRFDFTNLNRCRFEWELLRFFDPPDQSAGHLVLASGSFSGPDLPPHEKGRVHIPLPAHWRQADGLLLRAFDANSRLLNTWSWKWTPAAKVVARVFHTGGQMPHVRKEGRFLKVVTPTVTFYFDAQTSLLANVQQGGHTIPFSNGPRFVASGSRDSVV